MLPKKNRLPTDQIAIIKKSSSKLHTPLFVVLYKKNNLLDPRFAFVVSNKISKKAVNRNKIRRIFKAAILKNIDSFPHYDFLFIFKVNSANVDFNAAENSIKNNLLKNL